jgi:hypothetical protein
MPRKVTSPSFDPMVTGIRSSNLRVVYLALPSLNFESYTTP